MQNIQVEKKVFDLEVRTRNFAKQTIMLLRSLKQNAINQRIIGQLVGSSGSIGANYCEALESESRKDFVHKILIAKKEIKETRHWLELLAVAEPAIEDRIKLLNKECNELLLIFSKTINTAKANLALDKIK